jgi:hypothetical protein
MLMIRKEQSAILDEGLLSWSDVFRTILCSHIRNEFVAFRRRGNTSR